MCKPTITGSRSNADQASNDTRAESDETELLLVGIVDRDPGNTTTTGGKVGIDDNVDHAQAEVTAGCAIEGEPTKPDEARADAHEQGAVRLVVDELVLAVGYGVVVVIGETRAEHHRPGKSTEAAGNVDRTGTGKVVETKVIEPSTWVPFPVSEAVFAC